VLATYITAQSIYVLATVTRPHHSLLGIGWLAETVLAMFALAFGKAPTSTSSSERRRPSQTNTRPFY